MLTRSVLPCVLPYRIIQIGDASGLQSPLSFGGFGALTRHLARLTNAFGRCRNAWVCAGIDVVPVGGSMQSRSVRVCHVVDRGRDSCTRCTCSLSDRTTS